MKKFLIILIPFLLTFSCTNDSLDNEEELLLDSESVAFRDVVLENGSPVAGAVVSLYGTGERYYDTTNSKGEYWIVIPVESLLQEGYISLNVYHPELQPKNITYPAPLLANTVYESNNLTSNMTSCSDCLEIQNDNFSELHHLGDDSFGGVINSQFQKESDGIEVPFIFNNAFGRAKLKISFEAKGIQPGLYEVPSKIVFGEQEIILSMSPEDGSYTEYNVEFDNDPSIDFFTIITSEPKPSGDVDDFEFTSLYIQGLD